jgi:hypothetical protein
MRYVINDDDLEDWYSKLYRINQKLENPEIAYILGQMEIELRAHVRDEEFNKFLRSLRERSG